MPIETVLRYTCDIYHSTNKNNKDITKWCCFNIEPIEYDGDSIFKCICPDCLKAANLYVISHIKITENNIQKDKSKINNVPECTCKECMQKNFFGL